MTSYVEYPPPSYGPPPPPPPYGPTTTEKPMGMMEGMMEGMMGGLMQTADKFTKTTDILTMLLMMVGMLSMSKGRRRRDTLTSRLDLVRDDITENAAFAMMNKFDEEDCIGLLVCSISSHPPANRTREEQIVLETMKLDLMAPVSWPSVCQSPIGKYQLAVQVGTLSQKISRDEEICMKTFGNCDLKPKELMETIRLAAERTYGDIMDNLPLPEEVLKSITENASKFASTEKVLKLLSTEKKTTTTSSTVKVSKSPSTENASKSPSTEKVSQPSSAEERPVKNRKAKIN